MGPDIEPCAFCSNLPCTCVTTIPVHLQPLPPEQMLRLGALTLEQEQSQAIERHLEDQEIAYREALARYGPEGLITALLERDRLLLNQGRQIADGRTISRIAREMVRAALYSAGGRPDVQAVQRVIDQFEGREALEIVDARQLKLHGSTLGPLESPERAAEKLVSGERIGSRGPVVHKGALEQD